MQREASLFYVMLSAAYAVIRMVNADQLVSINIATTAPNKYMCYGSYRLLIPHPRVPGHAINFISVNLGLRLSLALEIWHMASG